jgi:hypothetical protein
MNASHTAPHGFRHRTTPWPIRTLLIVSILFGIWVDLSNAVSDANPTDATNTPLIGLFAGHSTVTDIVRTLASRQ